MVLLCGQLSGTPRAIGGAARLGFLAVVAFCCTWSTLSIVPLDPAFNSGPGTGAESGGSAYAEHVILLPDAKILVSGAFTTYNGEPAPFILRLNEDGTLDHSFRTGVVNNWVRHMVVQSDGKITIGGAFSAVGGAPRNLVARLNADGSLDPTFDPGLGIEGKLVPPDPNPPYVFWSALQPDGKILLTGSFSKFNGQLASGIVRLNPDGTRDDSFNFGSGLDSWGRSVSVQPNGQILLTGWFVTYNGVECNRMALINPDGTLDASFRPFFGDKTAIYSAALLSDGKRIVSGHTKNEIGLFDRKIARLNTDGSEDNSFVARTGDRTESVIVQPDGKILACGWFDTANDSSPRSRLARFNADGTLDSDFFINCNGFIWTMAIDSQGRLLIAGGFDQVNGIVRSGIARLSANIPLGPGGSAQINRPPIASNLKTQAVQGTVVEIHLMGTDLDGDFLTFQIVSPPGKGQLSGPSPNISYTPAPGSFGEDTFSYTVSDGKAQSSPATVTVQIQAPTAPPVAASFPVNLLEDESASVLLQRNDSNEKELTYRILVEPTRGRLSGNPPFLQYTPDPDFNGTDSFTYTVADGLSESSPATVTLQVAAQNDAPVARDFDIDVVENKATDFTLQGGDIDEDPITFVILSQPSKGQLTGSGPNLRFQPNANGTDSFTYAVSDGTVESAPATVTLRIAAENRTPSASNLSLEMREGNILNLRLGGSDPDGDPITFRIVTQPTLGEVTGTNGTVIYVPKPGFSGSDAFTYAVTDGTRESAPATVTILIRPVTIQHRIRELRLDTDGSISLQLQGPPLEKFRVLYSENGDAWLSLGEGDAKDDGAGEFRDSRGREPARFYRAVWP